MLDSGEEVCVFFDIQKANFLLQTEGSSQNNNFPKCQLPELKFYIVTNCTVIKLILHNLQCWNITYQTAPQTGSFSSSHFICGAWDGVNTRAGGDGTYFITTTWN